MMAIEAESQISELEDILTLEKESLLSGNYQSLGELIERKSQFVEEFDTNAANLDEEQATRVRDKIQANQVLLEAALSGIQGTKRRLDEFKSIAAGVTTYGSDGNRRKLTPKHPSKDVSL